MFDYQMIENDGLYQVVRHIRLKDGDSTSPVTSFMDEKEAKILLHIYTKNDIVMFVHDEQGYHTKLIEGTEDDKRERR